jgi:hypothetical protein
MFILEVRNVKAHRWRYGYSCVSGLFHEGIRDELNGDILIGEADLGDRKAIGLRCTFCDHPDLVRPKLVAPL